ncbi:MAG: hypothetical protein ACOYLQ_17570 [Hyphomicrobiaceae bacterium]
MAAALALAPGAARAATPFSRADYDACHARDEAGFRAAIEAITQRALTSALGKVDYRALVLEEWRKGGVDEIIDKRVDMAVVEVRQETSWTELMKSLAVSDKAQSLATAVAERVYRSDAIKSAFEGVAGGVGKSLGQTIELATVDAAEPALKCIRAFIGPRYGSSVANVVTADAAKQFAVDPATGAAAVSTATVALEGSGAIAGTVLLAVRRQMSNMAARVGQRLVGSVLSRVVSTVAGGVGLVLIAKDIWDFRYGVLPIIEGEMKSRATKDKVIDELAKGLSEQMTEHSREIAGGTADRVMAIWQDFRRAHIKVVDLAERSEPFRKFLDDTRADQLPRLDEIVSLILAEEGEDGVGKRLNDGSLHRAVTTLPPAGLEIARENRSLGTALAWAALAGDKLPRVVEYEIHRRAKPADFTGASLTRLLGLDDKVAAVRLASLGADARSALFELETPELRTLARGLSEDELATLARYLTGLDRLASQRVLRAVSQAPAKMQVLASARVRDAILASRDQMAAVGMMLRADNLMADPWTLNDDVRLVLDGRISAVLLWDKHPLVVSGAGLAMLIVLLMLRRLLFGGRRAARA